MMRDLQVKLIELDEQWDFIGKKQKRVRQDDPDEMGDVWLFVALAATQKAILSYVVGKRDTENTEALAFDLRARILNRPQITSDGYAPYVDAVRSGFRARCRFRGSDQEVRWRLQSARRGASLLARPRRRTSKRIVIKGRPDPDQISTSYVERFNLSTRMQTRRFTRLTNGFSKKLANHRAAVALWIRFYNFCRVHETLRCTPAMALGVTDHIWSVAELINAALEPSDVPPLPTPSAADTLAPATRRSSRA